MVERKLVAILAADVVGYSRMMEADEAATLAAMKAHRRELWTPIMKRLGGRLVGTAGDSLLVEFASVVAAVECAVTIQLGMRRRNAALPEAERMQIRMGVNIGEVIVDGDDIYGDGVNVAARLEAHAEPGGICLSQAAVDQIKGKLEVTFTDLGQVSFKNIGTPVTVFAVKLDRKAGVIESAVATADSGPPGARRTPLLVAVSVACLVLFAGVVWWLWQGNRLPFIGEPEIVFTLPDKPSLAVLPFDNLSDDPDQEYFSDGISENIITALSRFRSLFVISRNTSFTFKGSNVDVKQVASDLGIQYVLEGSVQKSGNRVRVTAQLIDAVKDRHIWAEQYDREISDLFAIQDDITEHIAGAVAPELAAAEIERTRRKAIPDLADWELVTRATWHFDKYTPEDSVEAETLLLNALEKNPDNSEASAALSELYVFDAIYAWHRPQPESLKMAYAAAQRAVELDPRSAVAHMVLGGVLFQLRKHQLAIERLETAIDINPNLARAVGYLAIVQTYTHDFEAASRGIDRSLRLNPRDPLAGLLIAQRGMMAFNDRRYEDATQWFELAIRMNPIQPSPHRGLAANYGMLDMIPEAEAAYEQLNKLVPGVTLSDTRRAVAFAFEDDADRFIEGLRRAGMPE